MKIFGRIKSRILLHGKGNMIKPEPDNTCQDTVHKHCKEELSTYLNPLLAIGTLGSNPVDSVEDHLESTDAKDFGEVNEELNRSLPHNHSAFSRESKELHCISSIEKVLDCLQEEEKDMNKSVINESDNKDVLKQRTISADHEIRKDIASDNTNDDMYKRSFSFLLKRMLLHRGSLLPRSITNPILDNPSPYPKADKSRMEKILRAMLHKRKYRQQKKCLETKTEEGEAKCGNWVKTDSEYIVLEL